MSLLAVIVAAMLTAVVFTPAMSASIVTFCMAGVANAMFFAATLAARSEFAPIESRGQIFIWVGALKIAGGAAGTASAGAMAGVAVWTPLVLATTLTALAAAGSFIERSRRTRKHHRT
jgi:MFS family permease